MSDTPLPSGLADLVKTWLVETKQIRATEITALDAYGSDWAGDTEGGFYSEADLTIRYLCRDGKASTYTVAGEEMQSLWQAVIGGWPTAAKANYRTTDDVGE